MESERVCPMYCKQDSVDQLHATLDLLRRLTDKLKIILPKMDGIIGLQSVRMGMDVYDGPQIGEEMKEAEQLLAGRR